MAAVGKVHAAAYPVAYPVAHVRAVACPVAHVHAVAYLVLHAAADKTDCKVAVASLVVDTHSDWHQRLPLPPAQNRIER